MDDVKVRGRANVAMRDDARRYVGPCVGVWVLMSVRKMLMVNQSVATIAKETAIITCALL